jgi:hypothetical protein
MLRHGWAIEMRIFWFTEGGKRIHNQYMNSFIAFIAHYQVHHLSLSLSRSSSA